MDINILHCWQLYQHFKKSIHAANELQWTQANTKLGEGKVRFMAPSNWGGGGGLGTGLSHLRCAQYHLLVYYNYI